MLTHATDRELFLLVLVSGLILGLVVALTLRVRRGWATWRMQRRFRRGRKGEERAVGLLEDHGYRILDAQASRETGLLVDGEWRAVTVRADFLASRGGRQFVVEVKTGKQAPDPAGSATRRQLLEYHHVFGADGLLLADMERNRLQTIEFRHGRSGSPGGTGGTWRSFGYFLLGVLSGAAAVLYLKP